MVESYIRDFSHIHPDHKTELIDIDSKRGSDLAQVYDIVTYPALIVMTDDGQMLNFWQGEVLPLMDEVAATATAH